MRIRVKRDIVPQNSLNIFHLTVSINLDKQLSKAKLDIQYFPTILFPLGEKRILGNVMYNTLPEFLILRTYSNE